jgi:hypothetical protein
VIRRICLWAVVYAPALTPALYAVMVTWFPNTPQGAALCDNLIAGYVLVSVTAAVTSFTHLRRHARG